MRSINVKRRLTILKNIISLLSVLILSFWITQVGLPVLYYYQAGERLQWWYVYFFIFPFVYLPFCLISCTRLFGLRALIMAGIMLHVALAAWMIIGIRQTGYATGPTTGFGLIFALLWTFLCVGRALERAKP